MHDQSTRSAQACAPLWLVGQVRGPSWEFQGVFSTEQAADAACKSRSFFMYPVNLDEELPEASTPPVAGALRWPRCDGGVPEELFLAAGVLYDVVAERMRQVKQEVWTTVHDDEHDAGDLAAAGAAYALAAADALHPLSQGDGGYGLGGEPPSAWPWDRSWWKPTDDPLRMIVKAAALLLAEGERELRSREAEETAR